MDSVILANAPNIERSFRTRGDVALGVWQVPDNLDCLSVHRKSIEHLSQTQCVEKENTAFG